MQKKIRFTYDIQNKKKEKKAVLGNCISTKRENLKCILIKNKFYYNVT